MLGNVLFHGSEHIVEKPWPGGGKVHNDYGQGFYCSENLELAKEWACTEKPTAFVSHYAFEPSIPLKIINLDQPPYHVLNWLAILLKNRAFDPKHALAQEGKEYILEEFLPNTQDYDIIYGYRADDSYFGIASTFLSGGLSLQQLQYALRLGLLGEQYSCKARKPLMRWYLLRPRLSIKVSTFPAVTRATPKPGAPSGRWYPQRKEYLSWTSLEIK